MNLRQLRYFVTIVDWGSLSRAAANLHVAQPALTQQLASLEAELKVQLVRRTPQGVISTPAGERLYRRARDILRYVEDTIQDVTDEGEVAGAVAIGLPTSVAMILAVPLVSRVREAYPNIHLTVFESLSGYLDELLARHRLDMSLLFRESTKNGISAEPLVAEQLFLVEAGPQTAEAEITMAAAAQLPLALPSPAQSMRSLIEAAFTEEGLTLEIIADIDSLPTLRNLAEAGIAATILPMSALSGLSTERLKIRKLVEPGITRILSLCRPNSFPEGGAAAAVALLLRQEARRLVADGLWTGVELRPSLK